MEALGMEKDYLSGVGTQSCHHLTVECVVELVFRPEAITCAVKT